MDDPLLIDDNKNFKLVLQGKPIYYFVADTRFTLNNKNISRALI